MWYLPFVTRSCRALPFIVLLAAASSAQVDQKLAKQGLKSAIKEAGIVYKQETLESVSAFVIEVQQAAEAATADGYQAEDLEALLKAFDSLLLDLRTDVEESLQSLGQGASAALADATAVPLEGALPADFLVGRGKALDKALARTERRAQKVHRLLEKVGRQLEKFLQKAVPVTMNLQLWPPATAPVLAFDETAVLPVVGTAELSFDLMATVHEPHLIPVRRAAGAGFASEGGGDVTVERLDLQGEVVDTLVVAPEEGRWFAVFDLPAPGPVVLRARQGAVGATRSLGAP